MKVNVGKLLSSVERAWGESGITMRRPVSGEQWIVTILEDSGDIVEGFQNSRMRSDTLTFDISVSSSVPTPKKGDVLTYKGADWIVKADALLSDPARLIWSIECYKDE